MAHSKFSASQFHRLAACPGSLVLARDVPPQPSSVYAAEGTAAHQLLQWVLTGDTPAAGYVGRIIEVDGHSFEVDDEMAGHIDGVAALVREIAGDDGTILSEQRVVYASWFDLPAEHAWGTADVIVVRGSRLTVLDLKYGRGERVDVEATPQLPLYGLGGVAAFDDIVGDLEEVELVVAQPRAGGVSRVVRTVEELAFWVEDFAYEAVYRVLDAEAAHRPGDADWEDKFLVPGESQCRWCPAKATCPALRQEVAHYVSPPSDVDEFQQVTDPKTYPEPDLARAMNALDLIEGWCKSVRSEVERRLQAGQPVKGWKMVEGKLGDRAWSSATEVEETLKAMRLRDDEIYVRKLISPAGAERLLAKENPRRWAKLQEFITRAPGKATLVPASDSRPALALKPVADEFDAIA